MGKNVWSYGTVFPLILALLSLAEGDQNEGVKTGRYQQGPTRPSNGTGLCYKRIPYAQAVELSNETGNVRVVQSGAGQSGVKTSHQSGSGGWVMILDCCEGYVRDEVTGKCVVYCDGGCVGGVCSPGGICNCQPGWNAQSGVCKPVCRQPCQKDAYCFAPDVCACKYGYEENVEGQCTPICVGGCENGDCVAFQTCRCRPGYVMNNNQKCQAVCEGGCPNGECIKPGHCSCHAGYVNPPGETETCLPDCGPNGCINGECTSPGVCTCQPGYTQDSRTRSCVPHCPSGCERNSHCVSPGRCVCDPGFYPDRYSGACTYQQTSRPHPTYGEPESSGTQCERPCLNGRCTGWNTCTCNVGYTPDPRDPTNSHCIPTCAGGCPNGVCSGPNFCICKPGYVKDRSVKGRQRCIPREEPDPY